MIKVERFKGRFYHRVFLSREAKDLILDENSIETSKIGEKNLLAVNCTFSEIFVKNLEKGKRSSSFYLHVFFLKDISVPRLKF